MRSPEPKSVRDDSARNDSAHHDPDHDVAVEADVVEVIRVRAREASVAAAGLLVAVVAVAGTAQPGFEADEVAFALAWTQTCARRQVEFGRWLTGVQPALFAAFAAGDIDTARAWVFYDHLAAVDDGVATRIAAALLPVAAGLTTSQLRDRLRRAILKADPDAAAKRARRSEAERYVATEPDGDGTASLFGVRLPAGRTIAAFERVDAYARARRRDGDARTLDQLRADTFLDLLEGITIDTPPVHRAGVIELTVPWATAIAIADEPATLAGYGPVAAAVARDVINRFGRPNRPGPRSASARSGNRPQWRYSIIDVDGTLLLHNICPAPTGPAADMPESATRSGANTPPPPRPPVEADPTRRTPGAALNRWITTRDRTCRAPGCRVPARATDLDHTIDHAAGGPTADGNLAILCRHHHRTKHEAGRTVTQPRPGHLVWTSPTGHAYRRDPDPPW